MLGSRSKRGMMKPEISHSNHDHRAKNLHRPPRIHAGMVSGAKGKRTVLPVRKASRTRQKLLLAVL